MAATDEAPPAIQTPGGERDLPVNKKVKHFGSPVLANNAALSWYTERAYLDDRYARWTTHGNRDFLRALTRQATQSRYFARGFPNSWNNVSEEMWSTFQEGYSPQTWRGTTSSAMEGFQQLVPSQVPACVRTNTDRSRKLPSRGSIKSSRSGRSGVACSCGGKSTQTPSSRSCPSWASRISSQHVAAAPLETAGASRPSSGASSNRLIRRLVFGRRGFDNEPTGRRVIHPTYIPGARVEADNKKEESDSTVVYSWTACIVLLDAPPIQCKLGLGALAGAKGFQVPMDASPAAVSSKARASTSKWIDEFACAALCQLILDDRRIGSTSDVGAPLRRRRALPPFLYVEAISPFLRFDGLLPNMLYAFGGRNQEDGPLNTARF
ncbi:unnamed protein product [Symbiodinium microadriaticum]|nr:unnamed protein product [Symbiodinium microadriaticum]